MTINICNSFMIGHKAYDISYDEGDIYFNSEAIQQVRSSELNCLSQILEKYAQVGNMIDVGANIGLTTLLMGQFANNILSIEPNRSAYSLLSQNCKANQLLSILKNCAVGETSGSMRFNDTALSSSASHIVTKAHISGNSSYDVSVKKLDDIVKEVGFKDLSFIKIDVEGFEWQVLKGCNETLKRYNPWVFLEFNSWTLIAFQNTNPRVFLEYLMDTYRQVGQVQKGKDISWIKSNNDKMAFLHENLVKHSCVDDLLIRYDEEK